MKIALDSNGSTGYEWQYASVDNNSDVIKEISKDYSVSIPDPQPGDGETTIWTFQGVKEGSTIVKFKYLRPWEGKVVKTKIFKFTVDKDLKVTVKELHSNQFWGDVNCDGEINMVDCILLKKYLTDNSVNINKENADVDENSKINLEDYKKLRELI